MRPPRGSRHRSGDAPLDGAHDASLHHAGSALLDSADSALLDDADIGGLQPFRSLPYFKLDLLALFQGFVAGHLNSGMMREQILAAVRRRNEAKAFFVTEPLHLPSAH